MYPLLTNDRTLIDAQVLEAHKRQPTIEKRFEQTKTVFEIALERELRCAIRARGSRQQKR